MNEQQVSLVRWLRSIFTRPGTAEWEPSEDELFELVYRLSLKRQRHRLRNSGHGGQIGSSKRRNADRFAREVTRRKLNRFRESAKLHRPRNVKKDVLLARCIRSPLLDGLIPDRRTRWRSPVKRVVRRKPASTALKHFSFLTHPVETLASIKSIAELEMQEVSANLHFDDKYCLDAGSYLVLAEVWHSVRRSLSGGRMQQPVQKVLAATGVGEHNRMALPASDRPVDQTNKEPDVWAFTLQRRRPALSSRSKTVHLDPQSREKTADRFCEKVNEWIGVPGIDRELTVSGKGWIAQIIGELLCNAERHSRPGSNDGDWSTTAFMVRRLEEGIPTFRCYIAFLSVGRSIAESLIDAAPDISQALQSYINRHARCGLSSGTLATVFALQDTVTRDPAARASRSGGTGLQDVLDFVNMLGGTAAAGKEPHVTVVSGKTCIQMRPPYIQGQRKGDERQPRVIWFNPENRFEEPPDGAFVSDLPDHFAGTLVSIAFTLDPAYFAAHTESDDEDDQSRRAHR